MLFRTYVPGPPLSDFVDYFWLCEGYRPPHARERAVPDGSMRLIVNLRDNVFGRSELQNPSLSNPFGGGLFAGAHSRFVLLDTASLESTIGVHFKPGGAAPFLRLPAGELQGTSVALETLWGPRGLNLRDELLEARTPKARFEILERYLIARSAGYLMRHPAVEFALKEFERRIGLVQAGEMPCQVEEPFGVAEL